jgi:hypothetical protein
MGTIPCFSIPRSVATDVCRPGRHPDLLHGTCRNHSCPSRAWRTATTTAQSRSVGQPLNPEQSTRSDKRPVDWTLHVLPIDTVASTIGSGRIYSNARTPPPTRHLHQDNLTYKKVGPFPADQCGAEIRCISEGHEGLQIHGRPTGGRACLRIACKKLSW